MSLVEYDVFDIHWKETALLEICHQRDKKGKIAQLSLPRLLLNFSIDRKEIISVVCGLVLPDQSIANVDLRTALFNPTLGGVTALGKRLKKE